MKDRTSGENAQCLKMMIALRRRENLIRYHEQLARLVKGRLLKYLKTYKRREEAHSHPGGGLWPKGRKEVRAYVESFIEPACRAVSSAEEVRCVGQCEGRWLDFTLHPRTGEEGRVEKLVVRATDITAMKSLEVILSGFEERCRPLLRRALIGAQVSDLRGKIMIANPAMIEMYRSFPERPSTLRGEAASLDPSARGTMIEALTEFGRVRNYEVPLTRKDGEVYSALINVNQIDLSGYRFLFTTACERSRLID